MAGTTVRAEEAVVAGEADEAPWPLGVVVLVVDSGGRAVPARSARVLERV
jgi:hypothetical protein